MKIKKYISDIKSDNLKSKLLSYSALGAAFLMVDGDAQGQCGVADAANPTLAVDIDGDGTTDVNINVVPFSGSTSGTATVPGASNLNLFSTQIGTLTASTYIGPNFSYYGCQPVAIPGQYGGGFGGGSFFQGSAGLGSYTTVAATAPILYQVNAINTFQYYFTFISGSGVYAYATGALSNNVVGLTAGASNLGVCAAIDSASGVTGPDYAAIGSDYNLFAYFFNIAAAQSIQYIQPPATAVVDFPDVTCLTNSYPTYGLYLPPAIDPSATSAGFASTLSGPFGLGSAVTSTTNISGSVVAADLLAVQFTSGGETHNGWVELTVDLANGTVTCANTGYQECSIETASAAGDASAACIDAGEATNESAACSPETTDIPTLSEWGLITLALLLMSYGSIAIAATSTGLAGTNKTFNFGSKMFALPFDNRIYRKALMMTGLLALAGFTGCFAIYGAIFMSDIIGVAIAGPVFAYLSHLLYLLEKRNEN